MEYKIIFKQSLNSNFYTDLTNMSASSAHEHGSFSQNGKNSPYLKRKVKKVRVTEIL